MTVAVTPLIGGMLIMMRLVGLMLTAPMFSMETIPLTIRGSLALAISVLVASTLQTPVQIPAGLFALTVYGLMEFLLGVAMGLVVAMFTNGARSAGELIEMQIGLGFASFIDPTSGEQAAAISRLLNLTVLLLILSFNGHHILLKGLSLSLDQLPPGEAFRSLPRAMLTIPAAGATVFVTAILVAAPAWTLDFLLKVGMALLSRAAPQLNVFAIGFIITIMVGIVVLALSLPGMGEFIRHGYERAAEQALSLCMRS